MKFKDTYRIGIYEKAVPAELSWPERLTAAKEAGFDYMEMSIDETDKRMSRLNWSSCQINEILEAQKQAELPIETICFSAQRKYPLGSLKWEKEAKEILFKCVIFAKDGNPYDTASRIRLLL